MAKMKIKKGDQVVVRTGKDKGKQGEVIRVFPKDDRVLVQGVNMVKRHTRPTQFSAGGILEKEASLHVSNVGIADPGNVGQPSRVGVKTLEDGRKVRFAKRSGETIEN